MVFFDFFPLPQTQAPHPVKNLMLSKKEELRLTY